jgi:hypothetical protein
MIEPQYSDELSRPHVRECNTWMFETETVIDAAVVPMHQEDKDVMIIRKFEVKEEEEDDDEEEEADEVESNESFGTVKTCSTCLFSPERVVIQGEVSLHPDAIESTWGHFTSSDDDFAYEE